MFLIKITDNILVYVVDAVIIIHLLLTQVIYQYYSFHSIVTKKKKFVYTIQLYIKYTYLCILHTKLYKQNLNKNNYIHNNYIPDIQ